MGAFMTCRDAIVAVLIWIQSARGQCNAITVSRPVNQVLGFGLRS
jgi:hypothetical protein